jgi:hypothetical protein
MRPETRQQPGYVAGPRLWAKPRCDAAPVRIDDLLRSCRAAQVINALAPTPTMPGTDTH